MSHHKGYFAGNVKRGAFEKRITALFNKCDTDRDGKLNEKEYTQYLQVVKALSKSAGWEKECLALGTTPSLGVDVNAFLQLYRRYRDKETQLKDDEEKMKNGLTHALTVTRMHGICAQKSKGRGECDDKEITKSQLTELKAVLQGDDGAAIWVTMNRLKLDVACRPFYAGPPEETSLRGTGLDGAKYTGMILRMDPYLEHQFYSISDYVYLPHLKVENAAAVFALSHESFEAYQAAVKEMRPKHTNRNIFPPKKYPYPPPPYP